MKSPTDVGTGKAKDEKAPLSEIIKVLNERFGTNFTEEDRFFFEQIQEKADRNEQVVKLRRANPFDKFQLGLRQLIEDLMVQRMADNDKIVTRYMDDKEFGSAAFDSAVESDLRFHPADERASRWSFGHQKLVSKLRRAVQPAGSAAAWRSRHCCLNVWTSIPDTSGSVAFLAALLACGSPAVHAATVQPDPAPAVFPDGRPSAQCRLDARDNGPVLWHGDGPGRCDDLGARDVWVWEHGGTYSMHYDGAGTKGWLACLATSTDLVHWTKKGAVLELGRKGADDSASASYGVTFFDGKGWHMLSDIIGLPSVVQVGRRLAILYDGNVAEQMPTGVKSHMNRDVGLAWLDLPWVAPTAQ